MITFIEIISGIIGFPVGYVEDQGLVKFTDGQVRSIRSVDHMEAVIEQRLAFVIGHTQQFH